MTKLEIIEETVVFYSKDPEGRRSMIGYECAYNSNQGHHCAVGRCFSEDYKLEGLDLPGNEKNTSGLAEINNVDLDSMLSNGYKGHNEIFWSDLQLLHDISSHWNADSISDKGKDYVKELKAKYDEKG